MSVLGHGAVTTTTSPALWHSSLLKHYKSTSSEHRVTGEQATITARTVLLTCVRVTISIHGISRGAECPAQAPAIVEVEATSSYYEKMSEELEKIVNEVKNSPLEENKTFTDSVRPADPDASSRSQEEVIKRIIELIKQEGDVINDKLRENTIVSSYFNTITYGSFKQLADQYVNSEVPQHTTQPPVVAPELVKFAFTLDFTARVAGLSRHAPGHILGFGNQYLKDRFTYMCESHPYINDISIEEQMKLKDSMNKNE
ncbi:potassium voltage-gated channel subfamily A member 10-like isoform X1, partial [Clarias magur]